MTDTAASEKAEKKKVPLGRNYWTLWTASVASNLGDGVAAIAYPWLASAVTRNAALIALIAIAQRIPWLIFTLPAGVITDRVDRRKIMSATSVFRTVLTLGVAAVVYLNQDVLPSPGDVASGSIGEPNTVVYITLLVSALLFGFAEVLYDNAAQTILPAIVEPEGLEKANGRLWGAEMVMNQFVGPPLGSVLIGVAFAVPFFFDAGTFAIAAALIFALSGVFKVDRPDQQGEGERPGFWDEIKEGVKWLWAHPLLRPMAIILGFLNGLFAVTAATFVLFAQEVLNVTTTIFAVLMMAGAAGGVIGSVLAPKISERLGSGTSLFVTLLTMPAATLVIGITSSWALASVMFFVTAFTGVLWNVITVSLRQTIIPDRLLGRVNSVYRFFAWGMMPIGLAIGGLLVKGAEGFGIDRVMALRLPYFVSAAALFLVFLWAVPKLTTDKIETARTEGIAAKEPTEGRS
ncbi:MAG: MFS transporter [Acidimicrobiia bacterium]